MHFVAIKKSTHVFPIKFLVTDYIHETSELLSLNSLHRRVLCIIQVIDSTFLEMVSNEVADTVDSISRKMGEGLH